MTPIRVLIVDDHPAIRAGVRSLLDLADSIEVVGEASTGDEAVTLTAGLEPDVVIMDLRLPETGGVDATRRVIRQRPSVAVLVLTMVEDDGSIFAAIRAGAQGYLRKESDQEELVRAVQAVAHGEFITSPGIAAPVAAFFSGDAPEHRASFPGLTEREHEVLHLIASGCNNQTIAGRLFLSPKTIRNHISSIFAKLQVADRAEAIVKAREAGLGSNGRADGPGVSGPE